MFVRLRVWNDAAAIRRLEVRAHVVVVGEHGSRRADFRAHVGDSRLACRADGARARPDVLDDGVSAAGYGEFARDIQDDVLRRRPSAHLAGKVHGDVARIQHFPRQARHHLNGVSASHAHGASAKPAAVWSMRVRANHQLAGKGIVFQRDLVDDAGARSPESCAELGGCRAQEVIDFAVLGERLAQVCRAFDARLNEVVAVDACGNGYRLSLRLHELEHAGLPEHVLQQHSVRADVQVALAGHHILIFGVVEVSQQHLVGERKRLIQPSSDDCEIALDSLIYLRRHFRRGFDSYHVDAVLPALPVDC